MHKQLAKINRTQLGIEDHGIFTAMLDVSYEGSAGQGIGGYCLDEPRRSDDDKDFLGRFGTAEGMQFVMEILRAVGVESWEQLVGKMIYVLHEDDSWGSPVIGIQGLGFGGDREPFIFKSLWPEKIAPR